MLCIIFRFYSCISNLLQTLLQRLRIVVLESVKLMRRISAKHLRTTKPDGEEI